MNPCTFSDPTAQGTIENDDIADITITSPSTTEGTSPLTFTVTLNSEVQDGLTIDYAAANGTATQPDDFTLTPAQLSFTGTPGQFLTIDVTVVDDLKVEAQENFLVNLSNPSKDALTPTGTGTINDNDTADITIDSPSQSESLTPLTFTVTLNTEVEGGLTIDYAAVNGTATQPDDFTLAPGNLNFTGTLGQSLTIDVTVVNDAIVELNEMFSVNLSNPSLPAVTPSGTGTIQNDDAATITIDSPSQSEGLSPLTFTVTLSAEVQGGLTINYETEDGTAVAGTDYTAKTGQVTFAGTAGETETIDVMVIDDAVVEFNETFLLKLTNQSAGLAVGGIPTQGVGTIQNDDNATVTINSPSQSEGLSPLTFTVTLNANVQGGITINYETEDVVNGALAGTDYTAGTGQVVFTGTAGETQPIDVIVNNDDVVELDEMFLVKLTTQASGPPVLGLPAQGTGTIQDNDQAQIQIVDLTQNEGDSGTTNFTFSVILLKAVDTMVSVDYTTVDDTATTGDSDYVAKNDTITFQGNVNETQNIVIQVNGDTHVENDETFLVVLSNIQANARDVVFAGNVGQGDITNDDTPTFSIAPVSASESTSPFQFQVTLDNRVPGGLTVDYATADGTATQPDDYAQTSAQLSFTGTPGQSLPIDVPVVNDAIVEADETFSVVLSNPSRPAVTPSATGTIENDDAATITIDAPSQSESLSPLTFTVTLSAAVQGGLTLDFETEDVVNGAVAGTDYTAKTGQVTFAGTAGETETIDVIVNNDAVVELDETFLLKITNQSAGLAVGGVPTQGVGTIENDDTATVTIDSPSQSESLSPLTFTVTLNTEVEGGLTIDYAAANGTATQPDDFTLAPGQLDFTGTLGQSLTIDVTVVNDTIVELNEMFSVNLSNPSLPATTPSGTGTIENDDAATVTIDSPSQSESLSPLTFTVTLSAEVQGGFTIDYETADVVNGAVAGTDYIAKTGQVTFAGTAGETETIDVIVNDDAVVEFNETFLLKLTSQSGGIAVQGVPTQGVGTIENDDNATVTINSPSQSESLSPLTFTATLSANVQGGIAINYQTENGTAVAGTDYTAKTGQVIFAGTAGETQPIDVIVNNDDVVELDEMFLLKLTTQASGPPVLGVPTQGAGTIQDNDQAPIQIVDLTQNEGNSGTTNFTFSVILLKAVDTLVSVDYTTVDDTATTGDDDYVPKSGTVTFQGNANENQSIVIEVIGDTKVEENETFLVQLSNIQANSRNVVFASSVGQGDITNDDSGLISIGHVTLEEGNGGSTTVFNFTVTLDKAVGGPLSLDFATADGTATAADGDYTPASDTLNFTGTEGEQHDIAVDVGGDDVAELDEEFFVNLSNLQAGGLPVGFANQQAIGTIENDDDVGACGFANNLVVDSEVFNGARTITACQTITVGPGVQIVSPANVIFRAGQSVILANGFSVGAGAQVVIEIDPTLAEP